MRGTDSPACLSRRSLLAALPAIAAVPAVALAATAADRPSEILTLFAEWQEVHDRDTGMDLDAFAERAQDLHVLKLRIAALEPGTVGEMAAQALVVGMWIDREYERKLRTLATGVVPPPLSQAERDAKAEREIENILARWRERDRIAEGRV